MKALLLTSLMIISAQAFASADYYCEMVADRHSGPVRVLTSGILSSDPASQKRLNAVLKYTDQIDYVADFQLTTNYDDNGNQTGEVVAILMRKNPKAKIDILYNEVQFDADTKHFVVKQLSIQPWTDVTVTCSKIN